MRWMMIPLFLATLALPALADSPTPPGADARCEVCGMFVAPYQQWLAVVVFKDGSQVYFDGPKDLFIFLFDLDRYRPGAVPADVADCFVTEYYRAELLPVGELLFVTGSDVLGPMGQELIPVLGREAAETFRRDHGGKKIMRFNGTELVDVTEQP